MMVPNKILTAPCFITTMLHRYHHPGRSRYAKKLLALFPPELDTIFFVNSGSEGKAGLAD